MKRFLLRCLLCGSALLSAAHAQTTQITHPLVLSGNGVPVTGTVQVRAIDGRGSALSVVRGDGAVYGPKPFTGTVTAGVIGGLTVPSQCTSTATAPNTPLIYQVVITPTVDPNNVIAWTLPPGTVCGTTFALDQYKSAQNSAVLAAGMASNSTLAIGNACTSPFMGYLPVSPYTELRCVNSKLAAAASSGGTTLVAGVDYPTVTTTNTIATSVTTETNRAQGQEGTLSTAIVAEVNRALAQEGLLCAKSGCVFTGPISFNTGKTTYTDLTDFGVAPTGPLPAGTNRLLPTPGTSAHDTLFPKNSAVKAGVLLVTPDGSGNDQLTDGPVPAVMTWTPTGLGSLQYTGTPESAFWPVSKAIQINSWNIFLPTAPVGCTTSPVLSIQQAGTILLSITIPNGTDTIGAQGVPVSVAANGNSLAISVTTGGVGCTTYPNSVYSNVEFQAL